ncbi:MAG: flippase-like domain-containing protein [Deltaproteobacteria bacterium]|nr:flippase-like domain-containing protein [Deltaproteobacteria bacterium]
MTVQGVSPQLVENNPTEDQVKSSFHKNRPSRWRLYTPVVGLVLLGWVLSRVDYRIMLDSLKAISWRSLAFAFACFSINVLIKAIRWRRMLSAQAIAIPTSVAIAAYLNGQFYGQVTLGHLGEFYRAEALVERSISVGRAMSSCVFDRLLDVFILLSLAAVLGASVAGNHTAAWLAGGFLAVCAACGVLALIEVKYALMPQGARLWMNERLSAIEHKKIIGRFVKEIRELMGGATFLIRPTRLLEALLWSTIAWTGYFATLWQLSQGIGCQLSRAVQTTAASLAALSSLLPITFSGLGVREVVFAQVLGSEGATMEKAVLLSLINLGVMVASTLGLGIIGLVWRGKQQIDAVKRRF